MGMSIDEHIGVIEDLKSTMSVCMPEPEKTEICTSLSEAIDIMHKYQRIEQIVNGNINGAYSNIAEIRRIINGDNNTDGKKLC